MALSGIMYTDKEIVMKKKTGRLFDVTITNIETGETQTVHNFTTKGLFRLISANEKELITIIEKRD